MLCQYYVTGFTNFFSNRFEQSIHHIGPQNRIKRSNQEILRKEKICIVPIWTVFDGYLKQFKFKSNLVVQRVAAFFSKISKDE